MSNLEYIPIKDIKAGMKGINVLGIILEISAPTLTKESREVRSLRVADQSAVINLSVWDTPGALLIPGDIIRVTRGYASTFRAALTLYCSKNGDLQKIGEFCMLFNEQLNMSEPIPTLMNQQMGPERNNGAHNNGNNRQPISQVQNSTQGKPSTPTSQTPPTSSAQSHDHKMPHKTYVRGRGAHRNNTRR